MKSVGIIIVILIIAGLGWYFYGQNMGQVTTPNPTPTPTPQTPTPPPTTTPPGGTGVNVDGSVTVGAKTVDVSITASGFSPSQVTIKAGDTVKFTNKDTRKRWPASGAHPTHLICPGFDAVGGIDTNETYSFKFEKKGECPMHDHLIPTHTGKITVE